ncbi:unnamed protein product [Pocillopora meandrina]|uniref:Uncharacterized protein n=1 Tax=Pocillopora meandrina TaxID=46732 RepID=A0AAU9X0G7_9CNID|nr:unnamed protein product [Pocillopora meandrina]
MPPECRMTLEARREDNDTDTALLVKLQDLKIGDQALEVKNSVKQLKRAIQEAITKEMDVGNSLLQSNNKQLQNETQDIYRAHIILCKHGLLANSRFHIFFSTSNQRLINAKHLFVTWIPSDFDLKLLIELDCRISLGKLFHSLGATNINASTSIQQTKGQIRITMINLISVRTRIQLEKNELTRPSGREPGKKMCCILVAILICVPLVNLWNLVQSRRSFDPLECSVVNEHLPLKQNRVKCRNQPKWFNVNILKEIRKRDNSLKKARKSNLERDWNLYKQEKNSVSSLIRRRKQAYYKNKISENKINTRKLWNLIKSLSCDDDESQSSIEKLIDSGNVITDKTSTAEL